MKVPKLITLSALGALAMSGCYSDGYYGQQTGGYEQGGYGNQGDYGYSGQQPPADYGSESGDVVTLPPEDGGYDQDGASTGSGGYSTDGYGPPTTGGTASGTKTYSVQKGDNLYRIGKTHGVSMQEIMQANGLTSSTIHPGQELIIP